MASEDGLASALLGTNRPKSRNLFATSTSTVLAVLLVLLAVFTKYTEKHQTDDDVQRFYTWYLHVGTLAIAATRVALPWHAGPDQCLLALSTRSAQT